MIRIFKEFSRLGKLSILFIVILVFVSIFSDTINRYPYNKPSGPALSPPSKDHIFGTDDLGIDLFAQITNGAKLSLKIGFSTALISGFLGMSLGIIAGYFEGITDIIIMRIVDILISLPEMPVMILLGAFFGPKLKNIVLVLSLFSWVRPARIVRSKILSLKKEKYIIASKSYGANFIHLTKVHFIKEVYPIISISMIKIMSKSVVAEAGLSFLGLGDPTNKSWGIIINHALNFKGIYFTNYWKWWILFPVLFLIILVLSMAYISSDLEKVFQMKV